VLRKIRIGVLPVETAGYVQGLEFGLNAIGMDVRAVSIEKHPMKYSQLAKKPKWSIWLSSITQTINSKSVIFLAPLYLAGLTLRIWGSIWVLWRFDLIILNNGRSLLPFHADLPLYRLKGIKIFSMLGHGSEIRPACLDCLGETTEFTKKDVKRILKKCSTRRNYVRRVESLSHIVISTPTLSQYLRRRYVNGHLLGIPVSNPLEAISPTPKVSDRKPPEKIKVVHIPSNPNIKGTRIITEVCSRLVAEGLIEFESKTGVSHTEALELLASSDLLVDWLYSDIYMPVLATEAAFLSKPAIVAGYAWEYLDSTSSRSTKPPVINIEPDDLEETIRFYLQNPNELKALGIRARDFVVERRNPYTVARKYARMIANDQDFIDQVSLNPGPPQYAWGAGSSKESIKSLAQSSGFSHNCFKTK
jgi:hypothetical protein